MKYQRPSKYCPKLCLQIIYNICETYQATEGFFIKKGRYEDARHEFNGSSNLLNLDNSASGLVGRNIIFSHYTPKILTKKQ